MKLKVFGQHMIEVQFNYYDVLFSYDTPVAVFDNETRLLFATKKFHSRTTSKHINAWESMIDVGVFQRLGVDQATIDNFANRDTGKLNSKPKLIKLEPVGVSCSKPKPSIAPSKKLQITKHSITI